MFGNMQQGSVSLKIIQSGFLMMMMIYLLTFCNGGFFTSYYAWMLSIAGGMVATVVSVFQRNVTMMTVDLVMVGLLFVHFIQLA